MRISIFITAIFIGLVTAGCSTTTYVSLKESYREQVEHKISDYEKDEDVGVEVTLSLWNGKEINGELLSVRDSTMIICTQYSATEDELSNLTYPIITFRNDDMKEFTIEGSNYVWTGMGYGALGGAALGTLVVTATYEKNSGISQPYASIFGGILGALVGAIAGTIVGYSLSTDDVILQEIPPDYDLAVFKPLARYPDEEPEYLRAIK